MDFNALPFDDDAMVRGLKPWVECESPTHDAAAVDRMIDLAAYDLAALGATIERIPGRLGCGGCVRATFPHPKMGQPGILIAGHMDTVHPLGTLDVNPFRHEDGKAWGPGIQDMKSGNYISMEAIRQLAKAGIETPLPITVLFTPDEEIGTPSTREVIEASAKNQRYVLVPEPSWDNGRVVWGRYAIARFNLECRGVPNHAGVDPRKGVSALREMAKQLLAIEQMTTDDATYSVGCLQSEQLHVNCVPSGATAQAICMAKRQDDLDAAVEKMLGLSYTSDDLTFTVTRGVTRPVWEPSDQDKALYEHASRLAKDLGYEIPAEMAGGGSDGNFTGAMGIPTLDSLGPRGKGLHTLTEHILVESLSERGKLIAGLLATLK
ncbi:MAG: M20/M25/M40 family metallo-hydrolase [Pseudomonadota bacterium]